MFKLLRYLYSFFSDRFLGASASLFGVIIGINILSVVAKREII
jgi:hypothetical protein